MTQAPHWATERRKVSGLKDWPGNPRRFTEKGMADLKASMTRLGYIDPIAINADGTIIGGHARRKMLKELGLKEVDVRVPDRLLTEDEIREAVVRLNKNIAGTFDYDILANQFEVGELTDWGFTPEDLGVFAPAGIEDQGKLDELKPKEQITCPDCGHEFAA